MRRHLLGLVAIGSLAGGLALHFLGGSQFYAEWTSGLLRIGAVLTAVWLALPELRRPGSRWTIVLGLAAFVVMAWRPRFFLFAAVVLIAVAILRPRSARRRKVQNVE